MASNHYNLLISTYYSPKPKQQWKERLGKSFIINILQFAKLPQEFPTKPTITKASQNLKKKKIIIHHLNIIPRTKHHTH